MTILLAQGVPEKSHKRTNIQIVHNTKTKIGQFPHKQRNSAPSTRCARKKLQKNKYTNCPQYENKKWPIPTQTKRFWHQR